MMRADFQPHKCTFLLFLSRKDVWRKNAVPAQKVCLSLAHVISRFEQVYLGTDRKVEVESVPMDYNDIWVRDTGPVPTADALVTFRFNAWGGEEGLYRDWGKDLTLPDQIGKIISLPLVRSTLTLEGGNLTTDGTGTLIAVRASILNRNRNLGLSQKQAEAEFRSVLGIKKTIWLKEGLHYDETGGHVDNLCVFAAPHTVLLAWTDDPRHVQYDVVHRTMDLLSQERDAEGVPLKIVPVPLPAPFLRSEDDCVDLEIAEGSKIRAAGEPIQASYINFVFVNEGVIVPQFGLAAADCIVLQEIYKRRN